MSQLVEVKVPDIGDFKEVEVIEVLVAEGDTITEEQSLITVESDKASMEIPSSHAGVVKSLKVKLGDKVAEGMVLLELEPSASQAAEPAGPEEAAPAGKAGASDNEPEAEEAAAPAQQDGEAEQPDGRRAESSQTISGGEPPRSDVPASSMEISSPHRGRSASPYIMN